MTFNDDYLTFVEGESEAEALRLDQRTELNEAYSEFQIMTFINDETRYIQKYINVRDYGNGIIEVGYSSNVSARAKSVKTDPEHTCHTKDYAEELKSRSMRRSRAQVRRKCMSGGLDYMLTLTYQTNIKHKESGLLDSYYSDNTQTFKDLTRFIRLVRESIPGWKYLAVLEKTEQGANHLHLAVKGYQDVRLLRECWLQVVGHGNIDVKKSRHSAKGLWNLAKLAGYLTKYITKNASSEHARQRYRVSEGIAIPEQKTFLEFPIGYNNFLQEIFDSLGATINFQYPEKTDKSMHGWACSW